MTISAKRQKFRWIIRGIIIAMIVGQAGGLIGYFGALYLLPLVGVQEDYCAVLSLLVASPLGWLAGLIASIFIMRRFAPEPTVNPPAPNPDVTAESN